jgi:UDP-N-acetylmuramate dehydrogenase
MTTMYVFENVPLSGYSTMRLGGKAAYLCEVSDRFKVAEAVSWAEERKLPIIMIGIGSNIVWRDEGFPGLIIVNKIMRFETFKEDENNLYVTVGAGENWDSVVERVVELGFSGIEELSLIPGTAGATPVQNVGAYGREIKDVLTTLEAFDRKQGKLITLSASECEFDYRTSRFKTTDKDRFFITAVTLHLTRTNPAQPFYESLQKYFSDNGVTEFSPKVVREAVIAIRSSKLPDPAVVANNGSFFQNPIISSSRLAQLQVRYPEIKYWPLEDEQAKVSAAWLLEEAGFKNVHDQATGMATWDKQPLVLVNEHATKTADLLKFEQKVLDTVKQKFGIALNQEPELLP